MKVTANHAEAVGERPTVRMEERLLLNRVTLHPAYIAPRDVECSLTVEAHFADPGLPIGNGAAVSTGVAPHAVAIDLFV
jgi:hypothetical protein